MKLGAMEIGIIVVIILIIFGVGRLPQIGSALGKTVHSFKKESSGEDKEAQADTEEEEEEEEPVLEKKPRRITAGRARTRKKAGRKA